jgi:hypothetical protein
VRKYPSCEKILREVKKVMKISLVNINEKKECSDITKHSLPCQLLTVSLFSKKLFACPTPLVEHEQPMNSQ